MSRSFRKPIYTDQQHSPRRAGIAKRLANRAVRAANKKACQEADKETLASGKAYRKATNSWDIRDWSFWAPEDKKAYRK